MLPREVYLQSGKKAVLLLHAYTGSPNDVRMLARKLEREGYTVLAPIFSGHGTEDPMNILNMTPDVWYQDAINAFKKLENDGYEEIAVFGLSMGGLFAMKLLEEFPGEFVAGGAFCSPLDPAGKHDIYPNFMAYAEFIYKKQTSSNDELEQKLNMIKMPLKEQLQAILNVTNQTASKLEELEVPIFLAQSALDEMIDSSGVYEVGKLLKKTYHEIHWYAKSTHVITISKERQLFEKDVAAFLSHIPWNEE
ncbi:alpha/beta fold hydrolase [Vagococcus carniphilus]|uniref:alpha/beta hydrolase n=1 Tax=Vagococcus carniphilus TaxID=218144 RepID=UPI00288D4E81|nr:alpha/beta fold hydrolase [Vagococcus carniphilus]MDT2830763.1 alpha/beta fold hydrolase [Vagococcus carniphilus]MDT2839465.1 alpha/beta fold hydrolase [Vagococcus carniphilus]MDT2853926.1 alpha/beta fold hydrolase [Vagococcus carniphilus]